jgi:hypothetical protein
MVQASERDTTITGAAHAAELHTSRRTSGVRFTVPALYDKGQGCSINFLRNLLKPCENRLHGSDRRSWDTSGT